MSQLTSSINAIIALLKATSQTAELLEQLIDGLPKADQAAVAAEIAENLQKRFVGETPPARAVVVSWKTIAGKVAKHLLVHGPKTTGELARVLEPIEEKRKGKQSTIVATTWRRKDIFARNGSRITHRCPITIVEEETEK